MPRLFESRILHLRYKSFIGSHDLQDLEYNYVQQYNRFDTIRSSHLSIKPQHILPQHHTHTSARTYHSAMKGTVAPLPDTLSYHCTDTRRTIFHFCTSCSSRTYPCQPWEIDSQLLRPRSLGVLLLRLPLRPSHPPTLLSSWLPMGRYLPSQSRARTTHARRNRPHCIQRWNQHEGFHTTRQGQRHIDSAMGI